MFYNLGVPYRTGSLFIVVHHGYDTLGKRATDDNKNRPGVSDLYLRGSITILSHRSTDYTLHQQPTDPDPQSTSSETCLELVF